MFTIEDLAANHATNFQTKANSIFTAPTELDRPYQRYLHLLWFAVGYGVICLFLTTILVNDGNSELIVMIPIWAVLLATMWLTALWAVFGAGSYLSRFCWSHLVSVLIVGAGIGLGSSTVLASEYGPDSSDFFTACRYVVLAIPAVSMATQLPFWFFRLFLNWQLVYQGEQPQQSVTLRDGFFVTFIFALACAAPQLATNFTADRVGLTNPGLDVEKVIQADGTISYEPVELTDPGTIERRQKERSQEMKMYVMLGYAVVASYSLVFSIFNIPVLLWMFRTKVTRIGCSWVVGYALAWFLFPILMFGFFAGGGGSAIEEIGGNWASFLACYGAALTFPIAVSRRVGFRLTSSAREQQNKNQFGSITD